MILDVLFGHAKHLRVNYASVHAVDVLFARRTFGSIAADVD